MNPGGNLRIAYKLLVNDRTKFSTLLIGITFAVFLMVQMGSLFAGVLFRSSATVVNVGASMWIMDPAVNNPISSIPVPDYLLDAVRSIDGVKYAVPLYSGGGLIKLPDGNYQAVTILGLDDTSLVGRPEMEQGSIQDIYGDHAYLVVHDAEFSKLGNPKIGDEFELNDNRIRIVGIAKVASSGLFGVPSLYTTYSRAIQDVPTSRFTLSYILVEPKAASDVAHIKGEVAKLGYVAVTADDFRQRISDFYIYKTGMGMNILMMVLISFVVGLSISAQTFFSFILENLDKFGALKAIGAKNRTLVGMILFQALFAALLGYGLGIGASSLFIALARLRMPDYAAMITLGNLLIAFGMVLIAGISGYIGIRRVLRIEPFDIFRG